jgi:hypothetical protein
MATFVNHVYVSNPETGDAGWFAPGDEVPDWATDYVAEENTGDPEAEVDPFVDYPELKQEGPGNVYEEGGSQSPEAKASAAAAAASTATSGGDYSGLTGSQLEQLLRERDLPTSGTNAEKRQRLIDDDMSME